MKKNNKFLTIEEAAAMLGTKEATIRTYIAIGRLESELVNGRRRIRESVIREYIIDKKIFKKGGFEKEKR